MFYYVLPQVLFASSSKLVQYRKRNSSFSKQLELYGWSSIAGTGGKAMEIAVLVPVVCFSKVFHNSLLQQLCCYLCCSGISGSAFMRLLARLDRVCSVEFQQLQLLHMRAAAVL